MRKLTIRLMLLMGMLWSSGGAFALERVALLKADRDVKGPVQSMALHKLMEGAMPIIPARPMMANLKQADSATKMRVDKSFGKMLLRFEKNDGQTAGEVKFLSRGKGYTMYFTPTESVMALTKVIDAPKAKHDWTMDLEPAKTETSVVRMEVVGGNPKANITGEDQLSGTSNYFIGNDKSQWRQAVPNYAKVRYEEVYPGIDLVYYGNQQKLEYDFVVKPGADPKQIALKFKGTENLSINDRGDLVLKTQTGEVIQHAPVIYQTINGQKQPVEGNYKIDSGKVTFQLAQYDTEHDLVIDPIIGFSTYLGGSGEERGWDIALDSSGNIYVTGSSDSVDFDVLNEIEGKSPDSGTSTVSGRDVFILKIEQTANVPTLAFSTFLGGNNFDEARGIVLDNEGNIYATGETFSPDFNMVNAIEGPSGATDVFVVKLEQENNVPSLAFSTYLGGSMSDGANALAVDSSGNVYVTGFTDSSDFNVLNEIEAYNNSSDVFVFKLEQANNVPSLAFSTFIGGSNADSGNDIKLDASANIYVVGTTSSADFNVLNELKVPINFEDAFLFKLEQTKNVPALAFSTAWGGISVEQGWALALDSSANIYLTGSTRSSDFTLVNELDAVDGGSEPFVTKIIQTNNQLSVGFSTYFGGSGGDRKLGESFDSARDITVDHVGNIYVTGVTFADDFEILNEIEGYTGTLGFLTFGPYSDAFLFQLSQSENVPTLEFSTFLGGTTSDRGLGIHVDVTGNMFMVGATRSRNFDVLNEIEGDSGDGAEIDGVDDIFITKIIPDTPLPPPPGRLEALNDFNGDGFSDLLMEDDTNGDLSISLLENSVIQDSGILVNIGLGLGWEVQATSDFNSDGKSDIQLYNTATGEIRIIKVDGVTLLDDAVVHTLDPTGDVNPLGAADFNDDGSAEIVLYNPVTGEISLIFLDGNSVDVIEPVGQIATYLNWTLVGTGDFNLDKKPDFLLFNTTTSETAIIEMDGSTVVNALVVFTLSPEWAIEFVADFNGDDSSDIMVRNDTDHLAVVELTNLAVSDAYITGILPPEFPVINAAEYDSDSKADMLILDTTTGDLVSAVLIAPGNNIITPITNLGVPQSTTVHSGKP